jgi:hypothetical protein
MKNMENRSLHPSDESLCTLTSEYMTAKDVYVYFGKRVSLDRCIELLQTGHIRSARIGGKLLTKREYLQEFENDIFVRTQSPASPAALSALVVSHKGIVKKSRHEPYRALKPR